MNWLEIYHGFERQHNVAHAERAVALLQSTGVTVRADMDGAFLRDAAHIKVAHRMSLADTMAVSLARRLNVPLASTDHHELDAVNAAGVCQVLFIR